MIPRILTDQSVIVWGSGRWASQYIKALIRIGFDPSCIHIFGAYSSDSTISSYTFYNDTNDPGFQYCLKHSTHSIIVNSNKRHLSSFNIASKYGHNILCEKPLCIPRRELDQHKETCVDGKTKFWESLIPYYASYLKKLRPFFASSNDGRIVWHDQLNPKSLRYNQKKSHDLSIKYIYDVVPNIIATLWAINICNASNPLTISDINLKDAHSGRFKLYTSSSEFEVNFSRNSLFRKRYLSCTNYGRSFSLDYTDESSIKFYSSKALDLEIFLRSGQIESPLKLQLIDFFSDNSSRSFFSTSACFLSEESESALKSIPFG